MTDSDYQNPSEMSDATLYREWQQAKEDGTTLQLDELRREITRRWEGIVERECDV